MKRAMCLVKFDKKSFIDKANIDGCKEYANSYKILTCILAISVV